MSFTVQQHHVLTFSRNVEHLLQQSGMRLPAYVSQGSYQGKAASPVEQFGTIGRTRNRARHTDTPHSNVPGNRRWVFPNSVTASTLIEQLDVQRMLIDLRSPYTEAIANTLGRGVDDEIGASFFLAAFTGENGTTSTPFLAAQEVGVNVGGANSGLNVPKLRTAKRILMASGLDLAREQAYIAITSVEHDNLLGELQVTNMDYNDRPTLVDGRVTSFMGFNFVHVEWQAAEDDGTTPVYPLSIPTIIPGGIASATRNIPCWVASGVHYAQWQGVDIRVDTRPDKNYNTQIWGEMNIGATRTQEKKVVRIVCNSA
jgi:hypothetical protein